MQNDFYDYVCQVIEELGLNSHLPVGRDQYERIANFNKKVTTAYARCAARTQSRLAMQEARAKVERWDILLDEMEVGEIMEGVIERGNARCRLSWGSAYDDQLMIRARASQEALKRDFAASRTAMLDDQIGGRQ